MCLTFEDVTCPDADTTNLLRALSRNGYTSMSEIYEYCGEHPDRLLSLRGVGRKRQELICKLCEDYRSQKGIGCSPSDDREEPVELEDATLYDLLNARLITGRVCVVLSQTCNNLEDVYSNCMGNPSRFSSLCADLTPANMREICSLCEQRLQRLGKTCVYLENRSEAFAKNVPDFYINNIIRAFGVPYGTAIYILRNGRRPV